MIVEIGGGEGGLKEYLEHGRKLGREFHRDKLDQRVPLYGDLAIFEIATTYESNGKKYDHVSLSFAENHVTDEMLHIAVKEFRDHVLTAWPEDQRHRIAFYAEAHRPRILSYINSATGEEEKRYTHIHIGIGRRDLQTGKSIEVMGYLGQESDNLKYIDAFQESFNARYGFSSPKDNPKITPENAADTIARYTGKKPDVLGTFNQMKSVLEITLQNEIVEKNITSWGAFEKLLSLHGDVSKMRKGRFDECFRIKPFGSERAMRLEGQFFKRQFIERSTDVKIAILTDKAREVYLEQMQPKKAPAYTELLLKEWRETTAHEIRFIHKSSPFYKNEYKPADTQTRKKLLDDLERNSHAKSCPATNNRTKEIAAPRSGVPRLSVRNVDGIQKRSQMLLQSNNGLDVSAGQQATRTGMGVRQANIRGDGNCTISTVVVAQSHQVIQPSSVLVRVQADLLNVYEQASAKDKYAEIRKKIDCGLLLDVLSHSHKINHKHYSVTQAKDCTPRIQCGSRALSPSDFLMKELGLTWREAAPILRNAYELQIGTKSIKSREKVDTNDLWQEFKTMRNTAYPQSSMLCNLKIFDANSRVKKTALATRLREEQAFVVMGLSGNERKAKISQEKMRGVILKSELTDTLREERRAYKDSIQPPQSIVWQQFLQERAQHGDEMALVALRKMDNTVRTINPFTLGITGTLILEEEYERKRRLVIDFIKSLSYSVASNGDVTYFRSGLAILRDEGFRLAIMNENDEDSIATALQLGREKFGTLTLTGSTEFQSRAVAVAVTHGIQVKFSDPRLEDMRLSLLEEKRLEKRAAVRVIPQVPIATPSTLASSINFPALREQAQRAADDKSAALPIIDVFIAPVIPMPLLPGIDWIDAQDKPYIEPRKTGDGTTRFKVVQKSDVIIVSYGRVVSSYPLPDFAIKVDQEIVINKDGSISIAPELTRNSEIQRL